MSEMSSGMGRPSPHKRRMPASHAYAPSGVMVDRWRMNHFTRGSRRIVRKNVRTEPLKYHGRRPLDENMSLRSDQSRRSARVDIGRRRTYGLAHEGAPMHRQRLLLIAAHHAALLLTLGLVASGCKPDYPSCETDKDCQDNGHAKEFCVARKCQQCRDSADCPAGSTCNAGKCTPIAGYCHSHSDCPASTAAIPNKRHACKGATECAGG